MYSLLLMLPFLFIIVGMVYMWIKTSTPTTFRGIKVYYTAGDNIYTIGIGKNAKIVIGVGVIEKLTSDELWALVYHEKGHIKKRHILKNIIYIFIISVSATLVAYLYPISVAIWFTPILIIASGILFLYNSYLQEYIADNYSSLYVSRELLLSAIIKLDNKSFSITHPDYKRRAFNLSD